jgi:hypothetical protein
METQILCSFTVGGRPQKLWDRRCLVQTMPMVGAKTTRTVGMGRMDWSEHGQWAAAEG